MKIVSVQVGLPRVHDDRGRPLSTGIFKEPVAGPVRALSLGLEGDGQADLTVHGGRDKAVYAYSLDAYPEWSRLRGGVLPPGAFGENLTVDRLREDEICAGDSFRAGSAVLQAVQPRLPCFKLAFKFGDPGIVKQFVALERPGIYFRVLQEGALAAGDELIPLGGEKVRVPIVELFRREKKRSGA